METEATQHVAINSDVDVVVARQAGRALAQRLGMSSSLQTMIATAISEIARNIVVYAGSGEMVITALDHDDGRRAVEITGRDDGPGIDDIDQAMHDGFSTKGSLGLGLPGARRLMDELTVESTPGQGTTVTMRKWSDERP